MAFSVIISMLNVTEAATLLSLKFFTILDILLFCFYVVSYVSCVLCIYFCVIQVLTIFMLCIYLYVCAGLH